GRVRAAITLYTRRTSYLKALAAGGARYNLAGEPAGAVSAEQQQRALETLTTMKKKEAVCA
ncbi:MAG: ProQ/FINO family protein, partial [Hafnia sp.]